MTEQSQVPQLNSQPRQIKSRGVAQATWRLIVFLVVFLIPSLICAGLAVLYAYTWGVIIWSDYYFFLCGIPIIWLIIAWIISAQAYVVPDNQRLVVFRMGKRRPKASGPGIVQLIPFIDEIAFVVDRRQQTFSVKFNRVPLRTSAGQGYILADPEIQLFISYLPGMEHHTVLEVQNLRSQIEAQASGSIREATSKYNVDQAQQQSPELIVDIEDTINQFAESWGIEIRVAISDWNFPETLVDAWTESEQAETRARAQQVLADARKGIVQGYLEAASGFLEDNASKTQIGQVALRLYMADVAQSFSTAGGALPLLNIQDFLKGQKE